MKIRDRIKELRRVPVKDIIPNPKNWRTHPTQQADALKGVLSEIGFADALLVRETDAGLELIDGHLRAEVCPDNIVPVLILDVTKKEADKLLASFDPLTMMADADADKLDELLQKIESDSEALNAMFEKMKVDEGITAPEFLPVGGDEQGRLDEKATVICPECGHEF